MGFSTEVTTKETTSTKLTNIETTTSENKRTKNSNHTQTSPANISTLHTTKLFKTSDEPIKAESTTSRVISKLEKKATVGVKVEEESVKSNDITVTRCEYLNYIFVHNNLKRINILN